MFALNSFRWRIALSMALLGGLALAAFVVAASTLLRNQQDQRLESELRALLLRELARPQSADYWQYAEGNFPRALSAANPKEVLMLVENSDNAVVASSRHWPRWAPHTALPRPSFPNLQGAGMSGPGAGSGAAAAQFAKAQVNGRAYLIGSLANPQVRLTLAHDLDTVQAEAAATWRAFGLAFPVVMLLLALGAWVLSGRALAPINRMAAALAQMTARGLHQRVELAHPDREFAGMVEEFNRMAERLERSFAQTSRFSADAAHELRTPLTILQGKLEREIGRGSLDGMPEEEHQKALFTDLLAEVQRLNAIVKKLLLLAQSDGAGIRLTREHCDLRELVVTQLEDLELLAPESEVTQSLCQTACVNADRVLLGQALQNLFTNAAKYCAADADGVMRIDVVLARESSTVVLAVRNTSVALTRADAQKVFERFFRADQAHNRGVDGTGLGLSLAREIVRAHGGEISLADAAATSGDWTVFRLEMPLADFEKK